MKKTLIKKDNNAYLEYADAWNENKEALQNVVDKYYCMGLPKLVDGDLEKMFLDTDLFMFDKITGSKDAHLVIGSGENQQNLPINKAHAMSILQKPAGYDAFVMELTKYSDFTIKPTSRNGIGAFRINDIKSFFIIDESGMPEFSERTANQISNAGSNFIHSDGANIVWDFLNEISKALHSTGANKVFAERGKKVDDFIQEAIVSFSLTEVKIDPEVSYLTQLDNILLPLEEIRQTKYNK